MLYAIPTILVAIILSLGIFAKEMFVMYAFAKKGNKKNFHRHTRNPLYGAYKKGREAYKRKNNK